MFKDTDQDEKFILLDGKAIIVMKIKP